ncbi:hypothetical protein Q7M45_05545 (plasmid) [Candidatus Liberibacter asiaticus]
MEIDLQKQFKNYLHEDVKFYLDKWCEALYSPESYSNTYREQKLRDKIIELRRKFAKENGLKTVTEVCPKPKDITYSLSHFIEGLIESERSKITEKFKPLAVAKVVSDELLHDKLNKILKKSVRNYSRDSGHLNRDVIFHSRYALIRYLEDFYKEIKHTFGNPADALSPHISELADEIHTTCFTLQFVVNPSEAELLEKVS